MYTLGIDGLHVGPQRDQSVYLRKMLQTNKQHSSLNPPLQLPHQRD